MRGQLSTPAGPATAGRGLQVARGALSARELRRQNAAYEGTAGVSEGNRDLGFSPAFLDTDTGRVYRARFADGRPAPLHLLDGLPPELVVGRDAAGGGVVVKPSLVAGFLRAGLFYTREQAARSCRSGR